MVAIAFVLALITLARRAAPPTIDVPDFDDSLNGSLLAQEIGPRTAPGIVVLRFAAPLFFANATVLGDVVRTAVPHSYGLLAGISIFGTNRSAIQALS